MIISGIQQMGIGIPNVYEAWEWYGTHLGMDIAVFDEAAEAGLMLPYTGGEPRSRHAILALNMQGGGGMEIWQYTSRIPQLAKFEIALGDLGIFITKIKSKDAKASFDFLKQKGVHFLSNLKKNPIGTPHFYIQDRYGNVFEIVEAYNWFRKHHSNHSGGVFGAVIGVTDIDKSIAFYSEILGYDKKVLDEIGVFSDFERLNGGKQKFRRVLLKHSQSRVGAFSKMLGESEIELVQKINGSARKIFQDRMWGDLGFIHLCFDVNGMDKFRTFCASKGHQFTVDSSESFDMGEAAGHFSYIEDPDGTLIEFVETHKVPILKKLNWYLDLRKRNPEKSLPNWMLRTMALNRKKWN